MTSRLYAAEFIFPGHPDKLSDAIADALVLAAYQREERALVGVEVAVHRKRVFVTGRIACMNHCCFIARDLASQSFQSD